jgi:hypothetical protein
MIMNELKPALISVALSLALLLIWIHYKKVISNEIYVSLAPQPGKTPQEKIFYSDESFSVSYRCEGDTADRWMLFVTSASNPVQRGYLTIEADDAFQKTFRTTSFGKAAGVYSIPLMKKSSRLPQRVSVKLSFTGGDKDQPLFYVPLRGTEGPVSFQIDVQPEREVNADLPKDKNIVYPRSLMSFVKSGQCTWMPE